MLIVRLDEPNEQVDKFLFMEIKGLPAVTTWKKRVLLLNLKNNKKSTV